tara:strand:+ start:916 stop:1392 length:477 start_codon:yes stop_codon:yes gene_type:complete
VSLPYDYYPAVLHAINVLGQGNTLTEACDQSNIEVATFNRYIRNDETLSDLFEDAQQRSHDAMADALINIDNHKIHGQSDSRMAKVISDNIKWVLEKRDSKRFGQRVEVKHEVTMDRAITDALNAAKNRTAPRLVQEDVIDVEFVEDEDDAILRDLLA